ncbi:MerR family transcriptional regulator, redox-sensitive transcriptional activator SoxR [Cognatiyoonia koreensis]|uniref:MerR family transcriptional regulator, redox-sensitive transcriptional activator SoxR n=1 Tax=Cognatiyoonia koreensis TaxID=364200 RepID=A0A1I0PI33_9RHOB|nr:redox-sensitive transcriptional activator SoxR [Cognatiyoonia koreensis]SEW14078.1 MerR family transcriptional regulator, redox-sensitive transcriptional activator SoxR [Cognatiyoonia koreensis]
MSGLTIGDIAARTGLAVSAIRFYEEHGIVHPLRNAGGHRRYGRHDIRRLSFVMAAQKLGFPLSEIAGHLEKLPIHKAPTKADWTRISKTFRSDIDARIAALEKLRDTLDGCIGCGCLSLQVCKLYNPDDIKGQDGPGPRNLMG